MPIYLFWGEDDFEVDLSVRTLREKVVDSNWIAFNYHKISGQQTDSIIEALNQALTPAFGMGGRLIWLAETTITQQCSEDLLTELQRALPNLPDTSHLLLTTNKKPDGRLKSTKLFQDYAEIKEFSLIPPWKTEEIFGKVKKLAREIGVKLAPDALELLAESVGNDTRQLWMELEKLHLYVNNSSKAIDRNTIVTLVNANTQNSLQLANAILHKNTGKALELVIDLIDRNESPLAIVATLVGQFRTWAIVKLKIEEGERDEKIIATAAEISNPKRIYFLRKEVQGVSARQLLATLPLLIELEFNLKRGAEPLPILQTKIIELCRLF